VRRLDDRSLVPRDVVELVNLDVDYAVDRTDLAF
jgi:hypothetical protein